MTSGSSPNVVGPGHASVLDGHLLAHAKKDEGDGVTDGDHYHRDEGLSVEAHTHTASGIEGDSFTIAVHTHTEDDITSISAHTHRYTETTTDDDDLTEVNEPDNHAHDGDDADVVSVYGHTHNGDGENPEVGLAHDHAGDNKGVSIAPLHSHADDESVSSVVFHAHSPSSADNAAIPIHSHPALVADAPQKNQKILEHAHLDTTGAFDQTEGSSSAVVEHEHSGVDKYVTAVTKHDHLTSATDTVLTQLDIGADHAHFHVNGGRIRPPTDHSHTATGEPSSPAIETHTHTATGSTPAPGSNTRGRTSATGLSSNLTADNAAIARHVHKGPTQRVAFATGHEHSDADTPSGTPLHTHVSGTDHSVDHAINSHNHVSGTRDILHNHVFHQLNGHAIRLSLPRTHKHADSTPDNTTDGAHETSGNPLHSHTLDSENVLKAPGGPYAASHDHPVVNEDGSGGGSGTEAPLHVHEADGDVAVVSAHTHTAKGVDDTTTGSSTGKYAHTHSEDESTDESDINQAGTHKHDTKTMGGDPYHKHSSGKIVTAAAHNHGTDVTTVSGFDADGELPRHIHDADEVDDEGVAVAMPPEAPADDHTHANVGAHKGNPIHSHTADYEYVAGENDGHTHGDHEIVAGPIFHSHDAGYGAIISTASHKHKTATTGAGSPLHSHTEDFTEVDFTDDGHDHTADDKIAQVDGLDHSHVSAIGGAVSVPRAHAHPDIAGTANHVDQGDPHVHAYDDGSYIVDVGPAYSGSGMLTFSNTGARKLAPETAEDSDYKDEYLVTKGQELGDLLLTYTAAGTMVKGAAISISTNLPIDQGFYPYNQGGGPGGAVTLQSGPADFAADPGGDGDGITEDSLYVETTRAMEAGNSIVFKVERLNIKAHGKEEDGNDPTTSVARYSLGASSASPLATPTVPYDSADLISVRESRTITVTAAHKTGSTTLQGRVPLEDLSFATAEEGLKTVVFTYTVEAPMAIGSQVAIEIPQDWPVPFEATSASDDREGAVTLEGTGNAELSIDNMVLIATAMDELEGAPAAHTLVFNYKTVKAPADQKEYSFVTRTNAGPHARGDLEALDDPNMVDVTGSHGAGTIELKKGNIELRQVDKGEQLGNLKFIYTAEGRMAKGAQVQITIPLKWTSAHRETEDGRDSPGEVSIGPPDNAELGLAGGGARPWKLTATTTAPLVKGNTIVFNYKAVTAPSTSGSYTFTTHATSFGDALSIDNVGARLESSPTVGVDQAPDGAGTVVLTSTAIDDLEQDSAGAYLVNAGEPLGNLVFTFTATGPMESGSAVTLTIPGTDAEWPDPTPDDEDGAATAGEVAVGGTGVVGAPSISDRTITVDISADLVSGNIFTITYKEVNAPTTVDEYDFIMQSKSTVVGGGLENLTDGSPSIKVGPVTVGKLTISKSVDGEELTSAEPGEAIGDITLTFTATSGMSSGAQVIIDVPDGWSPPSEDNGDTTDDEGEVALTSGAATHEVRGGKIVATTNADLVRDDTLVFTYKGVVAQATQGSASFATQASISETGTSVAIAEPAAPITVRASVTDIAIDAETSFFAGDDFSGMVTLWAGTSEATAAEDKVIYLSTSSMTGSFVDAADSAITMITIAAGMKGAAFTYNDTAPGTVTLTASDMMPAADDAADTADTSTALMATKEITVKSGVAGLSVTPTLVKAGSDVMVTATGKTGGGTVQVMDSDGMQVGATKSLDPVIEPEDGDVTYSRTITLPADLADGTYTVTIDIQDLTDSMDIEVLSDQAPPTLSGASARPMTVVNGDLVTLSVMATSTIDITSVMADLSAVDSTQTEMVSLTQQGDGGAYFYVFTISTDNTNDDGEASITITATDRIANAGTAMVSVTLDNVQVTLDSVSVEPDMPYEPGDTAWIKATGSAGAAASATVNNSETGMTIAQVTLEEMEGTPGSYVIGLTIVEDAHPEGMYDVTVTLGDQSMTAEGALTIVTPSAMPMFSLSIPAGTHLIHIPLDVTQIDGMDATIDTVGDLYDALGDAVNFIISLGADGSWNSYLGDSSAGTVADAMIGDDTGLIAVMSSTATLNLTGNALGTGGVSTIMLNAGSNLVGLPLHSAQIGMISDVVGNPLVSAVAVSNAAGDGFNTIVQAGDPGDGAPMGGQGYIVIASATASIPVIGAPWQDNMMPMTAANGNGANGNGANGNGANGNGANGNGANGNGVAAAPSIGFRTPVLQVQGMLIDEAGMVSRDGLSVSVVNLSSGSVLGRTTATDTYSMTFVKLDNSAAKVGDVLEIRADSPNPLLGIRPVQHVVTSDDVLNSRIALPDLVTYEIPALTELLSNYPNPFNPETWVPFRLAEDANVSLTIYGASGSLVRTIDIGFTPAAVYQGRSDAIYWDGRNNFGEQVSSGIYFYHLNAGDFSATRKMVIVK